MARCRNCTHYKPLAAKGTGLCDLPTDEFPAVKSTTAGGSCEQFTAKHPARRRVRPAVRPSIASVLERALLHPGHDATLCEVLAGIEMQLERIADVVEARA